METNLNANSQNTSVSVLMINAQGIMLSVKGNDFFISYNRVPWLRGSNFGCFKCAYVWAFGYRVGSVRC